MESNVEANPSNQKSLDVGTHPEVKMQEVDTRIYIQPAIPAAHQVLSNNEKKSSNKFHHSHHHKQEKEKERNKEKVREKERKSEREKVRDQKYSHHSHKDKNPKHSHHNGRSLKVTKKEEKPQKHRKKSSFLSSNSGFFSDSSNEKYRKSHSKNRARGHHRKKEESYRKYHKKGKSRSRSRSRNKYRRSKSKSGDRFSKKLEQLREKTQNYRRTRGPKEKKVILSTEYRINRSMLSGIIKDQVRTNIKMDQDEVDRATEKLRRIDGSGAHAKLMTAHINTIQEKKDPSEEIIRTKEAELEDESEQDNDIPQVCSCPYCFRTFDRKKELDSHMANHKKIDSYYLE